MASRTEENLKKNFDPRHTGPKQAIQNIWDPAGFFGGKGDKNDVAAKNAKFGIEALGAYTGGEALESTSGEPLTSGENNSNYPIFDAYRSLFGRNPTAQELAEATPHLDSGDKNFLNVPGVQAFVSQLASQQQNTPEAINKRNQAKYLADAPKHFESINGLFQSSLGRAASQDELNHFGKSIASGEADAYQLQQFLQQQPEYTTRQDTMFRDKLGGELAGFDKQYFGEKILPSIQEAYAKQGRSFDSSSFANSATQSAQAQNIDRQKYLAGISASQYAGRQNQAYGDYQNMVGQQQNLYNSNLAAQYGAGQARLGRSQDMSDYQMQANAYNQYLAKYGKRSGAAGALSGGMQGAAMGGSKGGWWGALIGGGIGAGAGYAGSQY